jgi:hypothetical protein
MTDPRHYTHHLTRALVNCAIAIGLVLAVIAVSALTVHLLEKPKLQSNCPSLIEHYKSTGVPAHIQIKCKGFLK